MELRHFLLTCFNIDRDSVMTGAHEDAAETAPVRQVGDGPMWLQVAHDRNVLNNLHGEECEAPDLAAFGVAA